MIEITPQIRIDERIIDFEFVRASGPGGQNVNKVATAVQLRFNITQADLPCGVTHRLKKLAGKRLSDEGMLIIRSQRYRTQERNKQDALDKLTTLLQQAATEPKVRHKTKPTLASKKRKTMQKKRRSAIKHLRRKVSGNDE